ncbi:MAG: hypothetical protein ABIP06_04085 [Pyrinomonadaceae bacterium]
MTKKDKKSSLEDAPFEYRKYKNGNVSVYWRNKEVTILKGEKAEEFLAAVENADEPEAQLAMAKITGHFKHGNERDGKTKDK